MSGSGSDAGGLEVRALRERRRHLIGTVVVGEVGALALALGFGRWSPGLALLGAGLMLGAMFALRRHMRVRRGWGDDVLAIVFSLSSASNLWKILSGPPNVPEAGAIGLGLFAAWTAFHLGLASYLWNPRGGGDGPKPSLLMSGEPIGDRVIAEAETTLRLIRPNAVVVPAAPNLIRGIDYWIDDWEDTVRLIEEGYKMTINDYEHGMYSRVILQDVIDNMPEEGPALASAIAPIDRRFFEATVEVERTDYTRDGFEDGWWFWISRLPRVLKGELLKDVRARGLRVPGLE